MFGPGHVWLCPSISEGSLLNVLVLIGNPFVFQRQKRQYKWRGGCEHVESCWWLPSSQEDSVVTNEGLDWGAFPHWRNINQPGLQTKNLILHPIIYLSVLF